MNKETPSAEKRVSDELLRHYLRPWYAATSVTIYRDIKSMAFELLEHRHGIARAEQTKFQAEKQPVTATEAQAMRAEWSEP
jgi:hypothetical protein